MKNGQSRQGVSAILNGWGYNFYRHETLCRADERLVREKSAEILKRAKASVLKIERELSDRLAQPAPERPSSRKRQRTPDDGTRLLARCAQATDSLLMLLGTTPPAEMDWLWGRHRGNSRALEELLALDASLVTSVMMLQDTVAALEGQHPSINDLKAMVLPPLQTVITRLQARHERLTVRGKG
jgi:hypothetical protein